jgi:hypothetical protein
LVVNTQLNMIGGKSAAIAHQFAGKGRVLFLGVDSTWLWRRNVGDRYFYKFWGQAIQYVARRDADAAGKSRLIARPMLGRIGEPAQLELYAFEPTQDGSGKASPEAKHVVKIVDSQGERSVDLLSDPSAPGRFVGGFEPRVSGRCDLSCADGAIVASTSMLVTGDGAEFRRVDVHRASLDALASASGGKMIEYWQVGKLDEEFKGEPKRQRRRFESSIWDNWLILLLLLIAYSVDVALRRTSGLS